MEVKRIFIVACAVKISRLGGKMISKLLKQIREVSPTYKKSDFNGLQVYENNLLRPHEIIIMVGSEIARQLKEEAEK